MKPSLDLARELASAVLDQVERDGALHDVRIAEAILARMAVCAAREAKADAPVSGDGDVIADLAVTLVQQLLREQQPPRGFSGELCAAHDALYSALRRMGKL